MPDNPHIRDHKIWAADQPARTDPVPDSPNIRDLRSLITKIDQPARTIPSLGVRLAISGITPPERFDPAALILFCHRAAEVGGYLRERMDRGVARSGFYYETGYGSQAVRVRFSAGPTWEVNRETYRPEQAAALVHALETENSE